MTKTIYFLYIVNITVFIFSIKGGFCCDIFSSRPKPTNNNNLMSCIIAISSKDEITCQDKNEEEIPPLKEKNDDDKLKKYKIFLDPNAKEFQMTIIDTTTNKTYTFTISYFVTTGFHTDKKYYNVHKTSLNEQDKNPIKIDNTNRILNNDIENTFEISIDN